MIEYLVKKRDLKLLFKNFTYYLIFKLHIIGLIKNIYSKKFNNPIKILYSHKVINKDDDLFLFLNTLGHLSVEEFESKIKYLKHHYNFISLDECLNYLSTKKRPKNLLVLTFDDGYKCIYTDIYPILKKYNVPATVFLTTGFLDNKKLLWLDKLLYAIGKTKIEKLKIPEIPNETFKMSSMDEKIISYQKLNKLLKSMEDDKKEILLLKIIEALKVNIDEVKNNSNTGLSWEEIREMNDSGLVIFGSHTISHSLLTKIDLKRAKYEIQEAKKIIEQEIGRTVNSFAYPNGCFDEKIIELVKRCGYVWGFSTIPGGNTDIINPFILNREGLIKEQLYILAIRTAGFFELVKPDDFSRGMKASVIKSRNNGKGLRYWLPNYLRQSIVKKVQKAPEGPVHIMLCIVDHFEPFHGGVDQSRAEKRVDSWLQNYPRAMSNHHDADGFGPQHTFFYPPHHDLCFLKDLVDFSKQGWGEIEMHMHHNHMSPFPDTEETLKKKIIQCIDDYARLGIFCLPDGSRKFAFVHGDWSLANSRGKLICGVNDEIRILKECGCYADFTFPSLGESQPVMINQFYYAKSDAHKAKAYNRGNPVKFNSDPAEGLMLVQGIIGLRWRARSHLMKPSIEASNIASDDLLTKERLDYLVKNAVTIKGKPDWKFIKLHTHGALEDSWDILMGQKADEIFSFIEKQYNDKKHFVLHYVSARQTYNIIKAAEQGKQGNPDKYRDFSIPRYIYLDK